MGKIERILLLIALSIYLLAFVDFKQFEGVYEVFLALNNIALIILYGLLGYKVFRLPDKYTYLSIYAGISIALSIIVSIYGFFIHKDGDSFMFLPIPNILLLLGLLIYYLWARFQKKDVSFLNLLILRSLVVALITSFFVYLTLSSKFYRKTIIALHNGNTYLLYNLKANDYIWKSESYIKDGDWDRAVEAAEISVEYALKWISQDDERFVNDYKMLARELILDDYEFNTIKEGFSWFLEDKDYYKIEGALEKLIDAYLGKADSEMDADNYNQAILFLNRAFVLSEVVRNESQGWNRHMISVYWKFGISYMRMNELENTEYFYRLVTELITKTETEKQFYVGDFFMSLAEFAVKHQEYDTAIYFLEEALDYFEVDPQNENYKRYKAKAYTDLVQYYFLIDGMGEAEHYLELALQLYDKEHKESEIGHTFPKVILNQAVLKFLQQDYYGCKEILERNFILIPEGSFESNTFNMLFHFYIAQCNYVLSEYEAAEASLEKAITYADKGESNRGELVLLSANIKFAMGEYEKSRVLFQEVLRMHERSNNENGSVSVLMYLANYSVKHLDYQNTKAYLEESSTRAIEQGFEMTTRNLEYFSTMAYVNYYLGNYQKADSLYKEVIQYNELKGNATATSSGSAMNGLGLVKVSTGKNEEAERLFIKSIDLYKLNFNNKHAHLGSVYLNYATLLIETNELERASVLLSDTQTTLNEFYKPTHDIFGDLYTAYGDLYEKKKDYFNSKRYYQKAKDIYMKAFGEDNLKVELIKNKLR